MQASRNIGNWWRLLRSADAAASVEYALILGAIVAALAGGLSYLGNEVRGQLAHSAKAFSHSATGGGRSAGSGSRSSKSRERRSPEAESVPSSFPWTPIAIIALALGVLPLVARRRARPQSIEQVQPEIETHEPPSDAHVFQKRQRLLHLLDDEADLFLRGQVDARHLMTTNLISVNVNTTREELQRLIQERSVRHLLVENRDGRLLGVISDRDLLHTPGATARELMIVNPIVVRPDTPISVVISTMIANHFSCVPVVVGEHACGIVTTTDLVLTLQCTLQLLSNMREAAYLCQSVTMTD